jgi:hypothetical protein
MQLTKLAAMMMTHTMLSFFTPWYPPADWFNRYNIHWVWVYLSTQFVLAQRSISDCKSLCSPDEFCGLVESLVAANAGMNLQGLAELLQNMQASEVGLDAPSAAAAREVLQLVMNQVSTK